MYESKNATKMNKEQIKVMNKKQKASLCKNYVQRVMWAVEKWVLYRKHKRKETYI